METGIYANMRKGRSRSDNVTRARGMLLYAELALARSCEMLRHAADLLDDEMRAGEPTPEDVRADQVLGDVIDSMTERRLQLAVLAREGEPTRPIDEALLLARVRGVFTDEELRAWSRGTVFHGRAY